MREREEEKSERERRVREEERGVLSVRERRRECERRRRVCGRERNVISVIVTKKGPVLYRTSLIKNIYCGELNISHNCL